MSQGSPCEEVYRGLYLALCREYGVFSLGHDDGRKAYLQALTDYLLGLGSLERILDLIELSFRAIDVYIRSSWSKFQSFTSSSPDEAIEELNFRFRESAVGYQFESGQIVRVDSQFLHAEAVKPVLLFLQGDLYEGANEEFLEAHQHYREGNYPECLNECLKAFESTMKVICSKRGWPYDQSDMAKRLIGICLDHGLIPNYLQTEFTALRTTLESGVPTIRNKRGGHGQGTQRVDVPEYLAGYALHMTAATILFLVKAEETLP